jgi:hypothetical protein
VRAPAALHFLVTPGARAACLLLALCACAGAPPASAPASVEPQRREYIGFSFDPPSDPRWSLKEEGPSSVVLWRTVQGATHTFYVRLALSLRDRALATGDELEAAMAPKLLAVPQPAKRLSGAVSQTVKQGQPCLRIDRVSVKEGATQQPEDALYTTYHGLYCNHPTDPKLGMYLVYSEQGRKGDLDPELDALAEKFLATVSIDVRFGVPAK